MFLLLLFVASYCLSRFLGRLRGSLVMSALLLVYWAMFILSARKPDVIGFAIFLPIMVAPVIGITVVAGVVAGHYAAEDAKREELEGTSTEKLIDLTGLLNPRLALFLLILLLMYFAIKFLFNV